MESENNGGKYFFLGIYPNDGFLQQLCDLETRINRLNNIGYEPYNLR